MKRIIALTLIAFAAFGIIMFTAAFGASAPTEQVIRVTAKKFEFSPGEITVKKG